MKSEPKKIKFGDITKDSNYVFGKDLKFLAGFPHEGTGQIKWQDIAGKINCKPPKIHTLKDDCIFNDDNSYQLSIEHDDEWAKAGKDLVESVTMDITITDSGQTDELVLIENVPILIIGLITSCINFDQVDIDIDNGDEIKIITINQDAEYIAESGFDYKIITINQDTKYIAKSRFGYKFYSEDGGRTWRKQSNNE